MKLKTRCGQFYAPRYESGSRTAKLMRIPETQFRHPSIISVRYRSIPVPDSITVFRVRTYSGIGIFSLFRYRTEGMACSPAF
jgi:hypothetical protein